MGRKYYNFSKEKFEYELLRMKGKLNYVSFSEISSDLNRNNYIVNERVYLIKTNNPFVSLLIYSSVDNNTGRVRNIGSDAVRVVLVWRTKKGRFYKRLHKHLRIRTLFTNLEKTIGKGIKEAESMNLKIWDFSEGIGIGYK